MKHINCASRSVNVEVTLRDGAKSRDLCSKDVLLGVFTQKTRRTSTDSVTTTLPEAFLWQPSSEARHLITVQDLCHPLAKDTAIILSRISTLDVLPISISQLSFSFSAVFSSELTMPSNISISVFSSAMVFVIRASSNDHIDIHPKRALLQLSVGLLILLQEVLILLQGNHLPTLKPWFHPRRCQTRYSHPLFQNY